MTKEEAIEHVAKMANKADNLLAATELPVPDSLHVAALKANPELAERVVRALDDGVSER